MLSPTLKVDSETGFTKSVVIEATPEEVWNALTDIAFMKKWMLDEEIEVVTSWKVGTPFIIKGKMHWVYFENHGQVLTFEPFKVLKYSHSSSLSNLRDEPESYCRIEFTLKPIVQGTELVLKLENFATESIKKHLIFYWNTTLDLLKKFIEN